jgi:shikimate dehydrogenase
MIKKYLIIGNPIEHSLSPKIHNYWFKKNNIDAVYEKIVPELNEIESAINEVKLGKLYGMNITVPFKQHIIPFLEDMSLTAKKTNSVNTVFNKNGKVYGDNTDVTGFTLTLKESGYSFKNKRALILGAGGVVPSLIVSLYDLEINEIYVSNRTESKLENLVENFPNIKKIKWGELQEFDFIVNATSVGLKKEDDLNLDLEKIGKKKFFYDVIYNPPTTNFLKDAKNKGHKIQNGKMMFIYQAQKAFELWHGFSPQIDDELINYMKND